MTLLGLTYIQVAKGGVKRRLESSESSDSKKRRMETEDDRKVDDRTV